MDQRLQKAAEHLDKQIFDKFQAPHLEISLSMVKAITRGGDPSNYKNDQILDIMHDLIKNEDNTFTIHPTELPTEIPYINFDVYWDNAGIMKQTISNQGSKPISELKNPLPSINSLQPGSQQSNVNSPFSKRAEREEAKFQTLLGVDRQGWYDAFPKLTYKLNNYGTRNAMSLDDLNDNEFIPVFGCSHTFGMGMPVEELWHSKLNADLAIYNAGVISGNLTDAYLMMSSMYRTKKFKKAYIVVPHAERCTGVSEAGYFESITPGGHYFLKQFENAPQVLNNNTRQLYRWMAIQNIINFCEVNDIELCMYESNTFMHVAWCGQQDIHIPNWYFVYQHMHKNVKIANESGDDISQWPRHTARDLMHFGSDWHDKMAEHLLAIK